MIIPIILGALGTVPLKLQESLEKLRTEDIIGSLHDAALISTAAILRRVLNLSGPDDVTLFCLFYFDFVS